MGIPINAFGNFSSERYRTFLKFLSAWPGYLEGEVLNLFLAPIRSTIVL
jgi:hypothetical protein